MSERQTTSPRRRLRDLRAIPDNDRTDEQWDELNELEITLAPANRVAPPPAANSHQGADSPRSRPPRAGGPPANGARNHVARPPRNKPGPPRTNGADDKPASAQAEAATGAPRRKPAKRPRRKPRSMGPADSGTTESSG